MIEYKLETAPVAGDMTQSVSIIGIGGAGANVLDHIALEGMNGVELIGMNSDARSLTSSMTQRKVQLGKSVTQGLGCGGDPELGQEAAVSSVAEIREALAGRRMIFLCVGLGGGTGGGAAPVIARLARESGAFVIVFATMPFVFEGKRRMAQAQSALEEIRRHANALVCFENDKMGELVLPKKGVTEAFEVANRMICQSVRAVTSVATQPGLIRIGMDDLVTALKNADSRCLFGFGQAKGEARATEALQAALKSPLLDRGALLEKARNVLVHICGGTSLTLFEIEALMGELSKHVSDETQILFGAACDPKLNDTLSVTIISSLGKEKVSPFTAVQEDIPAPAPAPPPAPSVTTIISQLTRPVPILSVQPRQAPPSNFLEQQDTVTTATSGVPVMKLTAQLLPARPAKPVRPAPLVAPVVEPDLFTAPEPDSAPQESLQPAALAETLDEPVPMEEEIAALAEPVQEEEVIEEEITAAVEEEWLQPLTEEDDLIVAAEEIIQTEQEEAMAAEEETWAVEAEEEAPVEAEEVLEVIAEVEELEELEEEVQHPAFAAEAAAFASPPMRPMEIPAPAAVSPARKFDLREILQRQRQTRLGQRQVPPQPAARPEPPATPARRAPDRTPDPARIAPIRAIPATDRPVLQPTARHASPFIPTQAPPAAAATRGAQTRQATFDERLTPAARSGRFEKSAPTVEEGEDLDVPTFLRKNR